jgi:Family of unknown function (DUF6279)
MTAAMAGNNLAGTLRRRLAIAVALLLSASVLGGCGPRLLYDRLDTVAGWYLGGLVTLDADQRVSLKRWLSHSLEWHRGSQLERYARFLRDFSDALAGPGDYATYDRARRQVETLWRDFVTGVLPEAGQLLASLRPQQVEELIASLEEEDARDQRKYERSRESERLARRQKSLLEAVEKWTGDLTAQQRVIVTAAAGDLIPLHAAWLDNRAAWRHELRAALAPPGGGVDIDDLERLLVEPDRAWTAEYRQGLEHNRRRILEMLVDVDATLSARQRDTMRTRLKDLAADIETMARG